MASSLVNAKKSLRRTESRKSHSWWWDSHISPKNSKWLAENLEEMGQNVKQMLKLIEGDGDSFAKKAEMYYHKRPELIAQVEEFYRMYRSLAERYDHLTGELRKSIPSDLHSQGSNASDMSLEPNSPWLSPDPRISHCKSGRRAAGFDFFLGSSRNNSDLYGKGEETSSLSDSETESDVSSVQNYSIMSGNNCDEALHGKMMELEVEFDDDREKLQTQQQEDTNVSFRRIKSGNLIDLQSKVAGYEEELKIAMEKNYHLEEEVADLRLELQKFKSSNITNNLQRELSSNVETENIVLGSHEKQMEPIQESSTMAGVCEPDERSQPLVEELRIAKQRHHALEKEVLLFRNENKDSCESMRQLQDQLKMAQKDAAIWKAKVDSEKRQALKLQERIARYKTSLTDRENEIRELKEVISDGNKKFQLHAEISRLQAEKTCLEEKLREWEVHCHSLEAQYGLLERRLGDEIEHLRAAIAVKTDQLDNLNRDLDGFKLKYDSLNTGRDELSAKVVTLTVEVRKRDDRIDQISSNLQKVIAENEGRSKVVEELKLVVHRLEEEVAKQKVLLLEGAEEKREVIRQLCFSLEHYRNGYHQLRQAFTGHKRLPVLAS